jgi:hypothetical protein
MAAWADNLSLISGRDKFCVFYHIRMHWDQQASWVPGALPTGISWLERKFDYVLMPKMHSILPQHSLYAFS